MSARLWTITKRPSYANDLADSRTLIAVTDNVNQAEGDQDPVEWLPPLASVLSRYLLDGWVASKYRRRLSVECTECGALNSLAAGCTNTTLTVTRVN